MQNQNNLCKKQQLKIKHKYNKIMKKKLAQENIKHFIYLDKILNNQIIKIFQNIPLLINQKNSKKYFYHNN